MMRIGQIILRVSDLDRSIDFWSEIVGFAVASRVGTFASLDGGQVGLTLNQVTELLSDESLTEIVIEVEDVRTAFAEMGERGVPFEVDLRPVTGDGARQLLAAHFRDPDGHLASVTGWVDV